MPRKNFDGYSYLLNMNKQDEQKLRYIANQKDLYFSDVLREAINILYNETLINSVHKNKEDQ